MPVSSNALTQCQQWLQQHQVKIMSANNEAANGIDPSLLRVLL